MSENTFVEETLRTAVKASFANTENARLREILESLTEHLHAFAADVELTEPEWAVAIDFLTRTGQKCDDVRQEFILLSDVLGVSMLVDAITNRKPSEATPSTVLGPFHMVDSPPRELGDTISLAEGGEPCVVTGEVLSLDGTPLPGALVDVWQSNEEGFYDVQQPGVQPDLNLRGLFTADSDGAFWFRTIVPAPYPIPVDGPVGELLAATGRHPNRPAHIHFIAGAEGHQPVTTHVFVAGSPWLDSDAVFGVKPDLIREFPLVDDPALAAELGVGNPFRRLEFQIRLSPQP